MSSKIQIEVRDSLADVPVEQWNALSEDGNPFLRHEFLHTLDVTRCFGERTGWYPRYFLLWQESGNGQELIGAVPAYIKTNSYGEFVFDFAWAEAYERHQLDYYPKLVASIPFTPATGRRLLTRPDQPFAHTVQLLAAGIRQFASTEKFSGAHFLFLTKEESDVLCAATLTNHASEDESANSDSRQNQPANQADAAAQQIDSADNDAAQANSNNTQNQDDLPDNEADEQDADLLQVVSSDHLARLGCQYHWHNNNYVDFDDFLSRCTAKRRKTIRRERRHVSDAGLRLEQRLGSTLSETEWRWVHGFYQVTFDRKWGSPSLTRSFFEHLGKTMGEQVLIVFAYDEKDEQPDWPVACSVMLFGGDTLYGRYWGCRADYNSLHFEACYYQGIDYCIANGIQNFEPGAQGEHKITRGFEPTITHSAHFIRHPQFREAIADFLSQETPAIEQRCKGLNDLLPFREETLTI